MTNSIEIRQTKSNGKGLFAKQSLSSYQTVTHVSPIVSAVDEDARQGTCANCFIIVRNEPMSRCGACRALKYCSKKCQEQDWKFHRDECNVWRATFAKAQRATSGLKDAMPSIPSTSIRLICRLLKLYQIDRVQYDSLVTQLISHREKMPQEKLLVFAESIVMIRALVGPECMLNSASDMMELVCKTSCNAMIVHNGKENLGSALYPTLSFMNHSCQPNCHIVFDGNVALLRTLRSISAEEELTIPYLDTRMPSVSVRQQLKETYFFDCHCEACCNPIKYDTRESILCSTCKQGYWIKRETTFCDKCGAVPSQSDIDIIQSFLDKLQILEKRRTVILQRQHQADAILWLKEVTSWMTIAPLNRLHPHHHALYKLYRALTDVSLMAHDFEASWKNVQRLLQWHLQFTHFGPIVPHMAHLFHEVSMIADAVELSTLQLLSILQETVKRVSQAFGSSHPIVKSCEERLSIFTVHAMTEQ